MDGEELDKLLLGASNKALRNVVLGYVQQYGIEVWQVNELKFNHEEKKSRCGSKKLARGYFTDIQYNGQSY